MEHVATDHVTAVNTAATLLGVISTMTAIFSTLVMIGLADGSHSLSTQMGQRKSGESPAAEADEDTWKIQPKFTFVSISTALPIIARMIVGFVVTTGFTFPSGETLNLDARRSRRRNDGPNPDFHISARVFWSAFVAIVLNLVASLYAWSAFSLDENDDLIKVWPWPCYPSETIPALTPVVAPLLQEMMATRLMDADLLPAFAMKQLIASYERAIQQRIDHGLDPDLGKSQDKFGLSAAPFWAVENGQHGNVELLPGAVPGQAGDAVP
jgi:hypothetical protein